MRIAKLSVLALLAAGLLFVAGSAEGSPGALDPSFGPSGAVYGGNGTVVSFLSTEGSAAQALLVQPDGKLVAVGSNTPPQIPGLYGQIALVRYDRDGSLDATFGSDGVVETSLENGAADANAAVLQPDGKIVVAGFHDLSTSASEFVLVRYDPDGSLDQSFGSGGVVETLVPGEPSAEAFGLARQPDGKLVAAGMAGGEPPGDRYSVLARYMPNGSLDSSFGTGGLVVLAQEHEFGFSAVALQPDGKILGVGPGTWLTRFTADGALDPSFGSGGMSGAPLFQANALALQPDGKIVAAGGSSNILVLHRVDSDGSVDPTFGSGGVVDTGGAEAFAVAIQGDGKIVAAGTSRTSTSVIKVARYNDDGSPDSTFGSSGIATTLPANTADAAGEAVALQPDGKIDVAGWAEPNGWVQGEFALARYRIDSTLAVSRNGDGSGSVISQPAGIACGSTCSASYTDAPVTLRATAGTGSVFVGWSGACTGTGPCALMLTDDRSAIATFDLASHMLKVAKAGRGQGLITSRPAGIRCGHTCSRAYAYGTTVTLHVKAAPGSTFKGWTGACSQTAKTCTLTVNKSFSATAGFRQKAACIVPRLKGKRLTLVRRRISRAHCRTGTIRHRYSRSAKGHVLGQAPHARCRLRNGTKVNLVISKGRRPSI
jgi:uncharacterized delta-60 repeat protein/uncharacterized repeat protein (TIGR02543 family)